MKKQHAVSTCLAALNMLSATLATAAEVGWQPRLDAGVMNYTYESPAYVKALPLGGGSVLVDSVSSLKLKSNALPFIGLGLTGFVDRWFVDVSGMTTANTDLDNYSYNRALSLQEPGQPPSVTSLFGNGKGDMDRSEAALSLGYSLTESVVVYGGYKWAQTKFDLNASETDPETGASIAYRQKQELQYDGPFVGATYSWRFPELHGGVAVNGALAWLQGNVSDKVYVNNISDKTNTDGDALGLTLGVSWQGQTGVEGLGYSLGVSGYNYQFNANGGQGGDFTETNIIFKGGLSYQF
jgi:hypothetical protein